MAGAVPIPAAPIPFAPGVRAKTAVAAALAPHTLSKSRREIFMVLLLT
jgi:hypothetical protein